MRDIKKTHIVYIYSKRPCTLYTLSFYSAGSVTWTPAAIYGPNRHCPMGHSYIFQSKVTTIIFYSVAVASTLTSIFHLFFLSFHFIRSIFRCGRMNLYWKLNRRLAIINFCWNEWIISEETGLCVCVLVASPGHSPSLCGKYCKQLWCTISLKYEYNCDIHILLPWLANIYIKNEWSNGDSIQKLCFLHCGRNVDGFGKNHFSSLLVILCSLLRLSFHSVPFFSFARPATILRFCTPFVESRVNTLHR